MNTPEPQPDAPQTWASPWRWLIGAALLVHLLAVVITPLHYASRSGANSSPLLDAVEEPLRPYTQAAFLNHGYAFFSPDPGSSRLIRYRVKNGEGEVIEQRFPDRQRHWPRLLYHRYFMLSEQMPPFVPGKPEPQPPKGSPEYAEAMAAWRMYEAERQRSRTGYIKRWEAVKQHLRAKYSVEDVELMRLEHMLPTPGDVLGGMQLTDKRLIRELPEQDSFAPQQGPGGPRAPLPGAPPTGPPALGLPAPGPPGGGPPFGLPAHMLRQPAPGVAPGPLPPQQPGRSQP